MIEACYLVKDGGLPIYTYHRADKKEGQLDDLIAPFLAAIDMFSNENFKGRIKAIVLEDGRKLYFRNFKMGDGSGIRFIAVTSSSFDNISLLDAKMINLKWIMEKLVPYLGNGTGGIPRALETELIEKIRNLLGPQEVAGPAARNGDRPGTSSLRNMAKADSRF
nr:hypothetical protein [Candidatus Sigynarchaeota archaeon]